MLGLEVAETKDRAGNKFSVLTLLDISSGFQLLGRWRNADIRSLRAGRSAGLDFQKLQSWIVEFTIGERS